MIDAFEITWIVGTSIVGALYVSFLLAVFL